MADKDKAKVDLGLLEEDDEFEEFPAEGLRIHLPFHEPMNNKKMKSNFERIRLDGYKGERR